MDNKKQKIIVIVELNSNDKTLILHGQKLASIFNKELCLFYNYPTKNQKYYSEYENELQEYIKTIKQNTPTQKVSSLLLSTNNNQLPIILTKEHEGILFVTNSIKTRKSIKLLQNSSVPFVFVHPESNDINYNHLIQPVDFRKEINNCTLWSSYFGRFNNAEIVMLAANDKTRKNRYDVLRNIESGKNLYEKFNIRYKLFKGKKRSIGNAFEALNMALSSDCNLLITLGSSSITPLDLIIGLPEKKIIRKARKLPVMIINPQRDNYILCD